MSGRPSGAVSADALRRAVEEAIGTRSLREVAGEIGISHTGLRGFLRGAHPHQHTRLKLERWLTHVRAREIREHAPGYVAPAERDSYALALAVTRALAAQLGRDAAARAAREYAELLRRLYRDAGREPPSWLEEDVDRA